MPPAKTDKELADQFADFFLTKIRKVREDLADCQTYSPEPIQTTILGASQPMTVDEVTKIMRSMPSKSYESDVIPTSLLKSILDKIAGVNTSIINISREQGVFACSWKSAIVHPLLKKAGLALT